MNIHFSIKNRSSGVLLHPTSLPGPYGVGDLGEEAYRFVDFLSEAGQTWWQTFPLGPTGYGHSPYQTLSVFAGNPLLISLEKVAALGLLIRREIKPVTAFNPRKVDFDRSRRHKRSRLIVAFSRFKTISSSELRSRFETFCQDNAYWLDDFSLFMALKKEHRDAAWWEWPNDEQSRQKSAMQFSMEKLQPEFEFNQFLQFLFFEQWNKLKAYARKKGVGFIGDVPIFVAQDSADVWAHPRLFHLNRQNRPTIVAGVPPDYFSKSGQRWGNPLYRWEAHKKTHYAWWLKRFQMAFRLFDAVRLDHFIGYHRYWAIPAKDQTAIRGQWRAGPRKEFFDAILKKLGPVEFIAEDLGQVTQEVMELRDQLNFPGMRILQFAFADGQESNYHRPHSYPQNCVVYPGTHDNDTIVGWFKDKGSRSSTRSKKQIREELAMAKSYMKTDGKEIHWDMIRLALTSVATMAVLMAQDLLGLGSEARMNRPGTSRGNWEWRMKPKELTQKISKRLYYLTKITSRISSSVPRENRNS